MVPHRGVNRLTDGLQRQEADKPLVDERMWPLDEPPKGLNAISWRMNAAIRVDDPTQGMRLGYLSSIAYA